MKHEVRVCSHGLTALATRQSAFPLVSVQFWVESGSAHEGERLGGGLSHLLEHMVFKGTEELSAARLNEEVSELGASWNAYTSTDRTVFHLDGPSRHWRRYLHLLTQLVFHPTFPEDEFERERDVIRREMAMYDDDPQDIAWRALTETLYRVHPRRVPVIGYRERFDALTRQDMVDYHRRHYVPGNVFVCVAGDVEPEAFFARLEEEISDLAPAPLPPKSLPREPRQWVPRLYRREYAQPTSTLTLAWRIPSASHPDVAPLSVLASILGDGRSARLYRYLHDEKGLAHDVSVVPLPTHAEEGAFVIECDVERPQREALKEEILRYLASLPQADFRTEVLKAQRQMLASRLRLLSTVEGVASVTAMAWHLARNTEYTEEWFAALHRVTAEDVARVAALYLVPDRLTEVSVDPLGTNPPATGTDSAISLPAPEVTELPCGLKLVTRVDRRIPMVHASLVLGAGCRTETEATAGINSLMSECLLKGTTTRTSAEIANLLEQLGGSLSSGAGNNTLSLRSSCLAGDEDTMLSLLADILLHPVFPEEAVETEKEAMLADIRDAQENPLSAASRRLRRLCFGPVSYGNSPDGTEESVSGLTREDLLRQHARLVCGRNAVLGVAGDIDPAAVRQKVEALFAALPSGQAAVGIPTPPQMAADEHLELPSGKEQAVLMLALPGETVNSSGTACQRLFLEWCHDMAGPVFSEIREKRGLAYYASSQSWQGMDTGCLYFYLGTSPEKVGEARAALESLLTRLMEEGMPEEALRRACATVKTSCLMAQQSCGTLCSRMALNTLLGLGAEYADTLPSRLESVTVEQMHRYIRRLLSPAATHTWITVNEKR